MKHTLAPKSRQRVFTWGRLQGKRSIMKKLILVLAAAFAVSAVLAGLSDGEALERAREILSKMTLEEKCRLLYGSGTMTLSCPPGAGEKREWIMSDNSSTVRPEMNRWDWGYTEPKSVNTKLPSLSALAQTWDVEWAWRHGETLGLEMRDRGVDQLLGPGVNIMRTPLNGRNWEYLGEDPLLAARMCVPIIKGVQSCDVAATVKHFCLNNQEMARDTVDTHVDSRTFNEIYLPAFRAAVVEAKALCVMTSYNKVDGIWASENKYNQRGILRDRWGFQGMILTDWGGQHSCDFAINNGGGVEMHWGQGIVHLGNPKKSLHPLADAVRAGKVPVANVDEAALRTLFVMAKTGYLTGGKRRTGERNTPRHQRLAREEGADSIVLLKNVKGLLPLDPATLRKVLIIGKNADEKQCHKGCSGEGNVPYEITLRAALAARLPKAEVVLMPFCAKMEIATTDTSNAAIAGGHVEQKTNVDFCSAEELKSVAESADAVIVFTGTELGYQENMESESRDRENFDLPAELQEAMHTILGWKLPGTVVVSRSGTPVGYTWTDKADTLVQSSYLGMEEGNAIVDVLFGQVNPSGRLAQSWPRTYGDTAVAQKGTYNKTNVVYNERFYVGYRWFDRNKVEPLFPFGYGLSYTTFAFGKCSVRETDGGWMLEVPVTNTGKRAGREVVQVYAAYPGAKVERCVKELKGFAKTKQLAPGETQIVNIAIGERDLAYWDDFASRFATDAGDYEFLVGASSVDIRERLAVKVVRTKHYRD